MSSGENSASKQAITTPAVLVLNSSGEYWLRFTDADCDYTKLEGIQKQKKLEKSYPYIFSMALYKFANLTVGKNIVNVKLNDIELEQTALSKNHPYHDIAALLWKLTESWRSGQDAKKNPVYFNFNIASLVLLRDFRSSVETFENIRIMDRNISVPAVDIRLHIETLFRNRPSTWERLKIIMPELSMLAEERTLMNKVWLGRDGSLQMIFLQSGLENMPENSIYKPTTDYILKKAGYIKFDSARQILGGELYILPR
ncbi:MAG: hypothetical protein ACT4OY_08335 [Alphaproteobacteria bacterium]